LNLTADRYLSGEPLFLELFQRVGDQGLKFYGFPPDAQCAGFDARDIEQIRDQPLHRLRATLYDPDGASPVIAFSGLPEQRFDAEGDRVNGIAQVVRDYGKYVVASPRGPLCLAPSALLERQGRTQLCRVFGQRALSIQPLGDVSFSAEPSRGLTIA